MNVGQKLSAVILIANHFDDRQLAHCLHTLQLANMPTKIIGLEHNQNQGQNGLIVCLDDTLLHWMEQTNANLCHLLILLGGRECITALLSEPYTIKLIRNIVKQGHFVAILSKFGRAILNDMGLLKVNELHQFLTSDNDDDFDFIQTLPKRLL